MSGRHDPAADARRTRPEAAPGRVPRPPSIRGRLAGTLALWSLCWGLAVGAAVWLSATHEVDELLDGTLQSSAELLAAIVLRADPADAGVALVRSAPGGGEEEFAWQVVTADGRLQMRSARAPAEPWYGLPRAGFGSTPDWRVYGLALPGNGRMLYAAQTQAERREARLDVVLGAVLSALAVGLLGYVWLRARVRAELRPLQTLSDHLASLHFDARGAAHGLALGAAERRELQPVHAALQALVGRLSARVASEQAFSAHAAHALRTPLAGIDAQLALALRECPPDQRERLQRVRDAAGRLQGVVTALLGLFRTGAEPQRGEVDLAALLARLPTPALRVEVAPGARLRADADLLAAALVNLLDNAQRHGARTVWLDLPAPGRLRLRDDGPGVDPERLERLRSALAAEAYEGTTGLGLMLADRVARAHGGRLQLAASGPGFVVEIDLDRAAPAPPACA